MSSLTSTTLDLPQTPTVQHRLPVRPIAVSADGLYKTFRRGPESVSVLQGATLEVPQGDFCAIVGASGTGKSTLLHLLATLDQPDRGSICYAGKRIDDVSRGRRERLRNREFGMVFQFYHLLPELTALENVLLPSMIGCGVLNYLSTSRRSRQRAEELLATVGLSHRFHHRPRELSGGEIQRAAIARALMSDPQVLFADEPTGNLDRRTGEEIMQLLMSLNRQNQLTIVMVTHDQSIASQATFSLTLSDGVLQR